MNEVVFLSGQVEVTANNVRLLQLFEDEQSNCAVVALHPPDDPTQGLELYTVYTHKDIPSLGILLGIP